jgi:hypothetical protein
VSNLGPDYCARFLAAERRNGVDNEEKMKGKRKEKKEAACEKRFRTFPPSLSFSLSLSLSFFLSISLSPISLTKNWDRRSGLPDTKCLHRASLVQMAFASIIEAQKNIYILY